MTETPKCPYCGAEMLDGGYTWTCPKCYSNSPVVIWYEEKLKGMTEEEKMAYAREAALHRAEPEMRPLTLEEVRAHCAKGPDAEPLWVEFDTVSDMALWVLANTPCGMDEKDIPSLAYWLKDEELVSEYGKFWRCWPRKPTPEQMAAEKWEE